MLAKVQKADSSPRRQNAASTSLRIRWRNIAAEGLYHSGALRILEAVARRYEIKRSNRGSLRLTRRAAYPKFVVLCYHRIGMNGIPLFSELPPEVFEAQMRYVRRRYRVLTLDDLCEEMENPSPNEDAVVVTFDDGYRDLNTHAMPALRKYRIPATIFLPVVSIETGEVPWYDRIFLALKVFPNEEWETILGCPRSFRLGSNESRLQAAAEIIQYLRTLPDAQRREYCEMLEEHVTLPRNELEDRMLTWDQIRIMRCEGISFGSHTLTHPAVSQLTKSQLELELGESKRILEERLGGPAAHFAYPFGKPADCGTAALPILVGNGYRSAATTVEGANEPGGNRYELRRSQIGNERSISMFAFKLSQLFLSAGVKASTTSTATSHRLEEASTKPEQRHPRATNA